MIRFVINGYINYINANQVEHVLLRWDSIEITVFGGGVYVISERDEGYDDYLKILEGITIRVISPVDQLALVRNQATRQ